MIDWKKNSLLKSSLPFITFFTLLIVAIFTVENINGRFWLNDFKVYFSAAEALVKGDKIYGVPFGLDTGYYKYSPFTLFIFVSYCLLSFHTACIIHFFIISVCTISCVFVLRKTIQRYWFDFKIKKYNLYLSLGLICIINPLVRELHLGNVNMILLFLLSLGLWLILEGRLFKGGILIGLTIMIKPYFLLLMLPLVVHKKIKTIAGAGFAIISSILIPVLFLGISKNLSLHKEWLHAMQAHSTYLTSNHTLESLIRFYVYPQLPTIFIISIVIVCSLYILISIIGRKNTHGTKRLIADYFIFISLIPNLVITDTEHFLLTLPLIMIILNYLFYKKNYIITTLFIIVIFFWAGNSTDLLGDSLSDQFEKMGFLGLSNLALILFVIFIYMKNNTRVQEPKT